MGKDAVRQESGKPLFRRSASSTAGYRLFGRADAVMPPSALAALAVSVISLFALVATAIIVEVPQRAKAVGILMPPGGFLDVVAAEAGQVSGIYVEDGQPVSAGQLLLEISATGTNVLGESQTVAQLRSLRAELGFLRQVRDQQRQISSDRVASVQVELGATRRRVQLAGQQRAAQREELAVLETRFRRLQELAGEGHIARDAIDLEFASLLRARSASSELEQQLVGLRMDLGRLEHLHAEARRTTALRESEFELRAEKLRREIELGAYLAEQGIRSAMDGIVARVLVRPGAVVQQGQVLARLHKQDEVLEAWLYLSSGTARLLRVGQPVELQLDAWPQSVFGSRTAIVSSVSGIALTPTELAVPLTLSGPVFEVRATLQDSVMTAYGAEWPIAPGTSFRAEVIQRRLMLYQWLLRALYHDAEGSHV